MAYITLGLYSYIVIRVYPFDKPSMHNANEYCNYW